VFIAGLPGSMLSDQFIIARALFTKLYKPKLVVVTLSPRNFIDANRLLGTTSEPLAFFSKYDALRRESGRFLQVEKNIYSDRISSLTLGKPFDPICVGETVICPGDRYLFYDSSEDYKRRYAYPCGKQCESQLVCLDSLFRYLKEQHISAVAIELPLTFANQILLADNFWRYYKKRVAEICRKNDVDYWDTTSIWGDFSLSEFSDSVHLNIHGGLKLTRPVVLSVIYKLHLPMYTYSGNAGPLVPGKENVYFHHSGTSRIDKSHEP
jgi:hypothetical protein